MSKITLNRIASSYPFTAALNNIIAEIESEFNTKVLYKNNPIGENNSLAQDLDLDGHDIINVTKIEAQSITVNGEEYLPNLVAYKDAAQYFANESQLFANEASVSAAAAQLAAEEAQAAATAAAPGSATTLAEGLVTLSDDTAAQAKTGTTVITAGNLAALNATDTMSGLVEKATLAEAQAAIADKFPDAAGVKAYVDQFGIGGLRDFRSTIYSTGVPSDLYLKGTAFGFADADELGIAGYPINSYGALEVGYQWTDASGSKSAYRRFITGGSARPVEFLQTAISPDAWGSWNLVYNQSNIVGTVSQSGGIPTGAIIETGSNPNGTYTKFADGTMICHGVVTRDVTITTATGSSFESSVASIIYPATFAALPIHLGVSQHQSTSVWISAATPSTTTFGTFFMMAGTSRANQAYAVTFLAIGRWY